MMRTVGLALVVGAGVGALVAPAWSGEIYSWSDESGKAHYSNTPVSSARSVGGAGSDSAPSPAAAAAGAGPGEAATRDDADVFSTQASLQRTAIERSMRETQRALAEVDTHLRTLGRARTERAGGSAATGGVGTNAAVQGDDERALLDHRKQLTDRLAALQADYAKLRSEVVARLGGTPDWWVEFRPGRR